MQAHATDLRSEIRNDWDEIAAGGPCPDEAGLDAFVRQVVNDWRSADLREPVRALLAFTEQLTTAPATLTSDNVGNLRACGWSDLAIHDATQVVSYFNYINRIADALGVEIETDLPDWER